MTSSATEQAELMLKLQSQFGDMDLSHLLNDQQPEEDEEESEESSLAEPSPEELKAWQEAQFQKGQAQVQAKQDATKSAVQRRRHDLTEDDWEQVPAAPNLQGQSSVFFNNSNNGGAEIVGVHPLLQQLAAGEELLGTAWQRLYSSAQGDGLSFANLMQRLEGYPGPTVLLIGAVPSDSKSLTKSSLNSTATTIGFFRTSAWSSATPCSDCFLFAFDNEDKVQFFRPLDKNKPVSLHYCHQSSTNKQTNNGLWIGGSASQPRLHLTESLEECRAFDYCNVLQAGDLLLGHAKEALNYFDVSNLEVWAVGGEEWIQESLETQRRVQAIGEANRAKASKVDKQQLLQDFQSGLLNTSGHGKAGGLFAHHGYNTDRCDL